MIWPGIPHNTALPDAAAATAVVADNDSNKMQPEPQQPEPQLTADASASAPAAGGVARSLAAAAAAAGRPRQLTKEQQAIIAQARTGRRDSVMVFYIIPGLVSLCIRSSPALCITPYPPAGASTGRRDSASRARDRGRGDGQDHDAGTPHSEAGSGGPHGGALCRVRQIDAGAPLTRYRRWHYRAL